MPHAYTSFRLSNKLDACATDRRGNIYKGKLIEVNIQNRTILLVDNTHENYPNFIQLDTLDLVYLSIFDAEKKPGCKYMFKGLLPTGSSHRPVVAGCRPGTSPANRHRLHVLAAHGPRVYQPTTAAAAHRQSNPSTDHQALFYSDWLRANSSVSSSLNSGSSSTALFCSHIPPPSMPSHDMSGQAQASAASRASPSHSKAVPAPSSFFHQSPAVDLYPSLAAGCQFNTCCPSTNAAAGLYSKSGVAASPHLSSGFGGSSSYSTSSPSLSPVSCLEDAVGGGSGTGQSVSQALGFCYDFSKISV